MDYYEEKSRRHGGTVFALLSAIMMVALFIMGVVFVIEAILDAG